MAAKYQALGLFSVCFGVETKVNGLVRWCSSKIAKNLVVETVAEWLVLASQIGPQVGFSSRKG